MLEDKFSRRKRSILGIERQWRRRVVSIRSSWSLENLLEASFTIVTLLVSIEWQNDSGPTGDPRRTKPSLTMGMSDGNGLELKVLDLGIWRSDMDLFKK